MMKENNQPFTGMGRRRKGGGFASIHGRYRRSDGEGNWSDEDTWKQKGTVAQNFDAAVGNNRSPHREGKKVEDDGGFSNQIQLRCNFLSWW